MSCDDQSRMYTGEDLRILCKQLGKTIRSARKRRRLTQRALASQSHLHTSHLSKIERGEANTTIASLFAIAMPLEITLAELFQEIRLPHSSG